MTAFDHLRRYPSGRPSTLSHLAQRDKTHAQLRKEVESLRHPLRAWLRKFIRRS